MYGYAMVHTNPMVNVASQFFRALPSFKGKTRLIRILNQTFLLLGAKPLTQCQFTDQTRFIIDLRTRTESVPGYLGSYDSDTNILIKKLVKPGWIALDVGANIGFISVPLALQLGKSGKLFCFEPLPTNFERLKENLKINGVDEQTECLSMALSDTEGEMHLGLFGDFQNGGSTGNAVPMAPGQPTPFKEVRVKKMTLDSWVEKQRLSQLDFIKLDIEGHEDCFLKGASQTIKKFRPYILGEFSEGHMKYKGLDVDQFFKDFSLAHNYGAFSFEGGTLKPIYTLKGRKNFEDVLLIPKEKSGSF